MKTVKTVVILFALACAIGNSPSAVLLESPTGRQAEIALIEKSIHASIGWAKKKDFQLLYSVIADDSSYIEVDPDSGLVTGIGQFRKNEAFWRSPDFEAISYRIRDLRVNLSQSGTVAWFYCLLDDINRWKGNPANWVNTRWTGVLEKRNGRWVIVQMHFSFAAGRP